MCALTEYKARYDVEAVRERMELPQLCAQLGVELRTAGGGRWAGLCPFHSERSPSFTVSRSAAHGWRFFCFGCGEKGSCFDLWMKLRGGNFEDSVRDLAGLAGMGPMPNNWKPQKVRKVAEPLAEEPVKRASMPRMRALSEASCEELGRLRGVSAAAVSAAGRAGLVGGALMGMTKWGALTWGAEMDGLAETGGLRVMPERCWLVGDGMGYVCQARRMCGLAWPVMRSEKGVKALTIGTAKWPIGAAGAAGQGRNVQVGAGSGRRKVALVEGGPDLLAAFEFLLRDGRVDAVDVVAMLGASVRMREEALGFFTHARVRIFAHYDREDPKNGRRAGWEAAARWEGQLLAAGAEVDVWDFEGLGRMVDGERVAVGDLNDAAMGDVECEREMRGAMDF